MRSGARLVTQLATRWGVNEKTAREFLEHFAAQGLATENNGLWQATDFACRRHAGLALWERGKPLTDLL